MKKLVETDGISIHLGHISMTAHFLGTSMKHGWVNKRWRIPKDPAKQKTDMNTGAREGYCPIG